MMKRERILPLIELVGIGMLLALILNVVLVFGWDVRTMDYVNIPLYWIIAIATGIAFVIDIVLQVKKMIEK